MFDKNLSIRVTLDEAADGKTSLIAVHLLSCATHPLPHHPRLDGELPRPPVLVSSSSESEEVSSSRLCQCRKVTEIAATGVDGMVAVDEHNITPDVLVCSDERRKRILGIAEVDEKPYRKQLAKIICDQTRVFAIAEVE